MSELENKVLQHAKSLQEKQLRLTRDLVAIPTVNPYSGDASAGSEAPGQDWIEDQFRKLGGATRRIGVPGDVYARAGFTGPAGRKWDGRENVVATWTLGNGKGPTILLNDHMDTVGTEGMEFDPFDPRVVDGRLYGRGSTDTKGNLIVGLIAVETLLHAAKGINGTIVYESVVDEECDGAGAGTIACCLAGVTGDVAIGLDGSFGAINSGCNGIATARLIVRGKSGHNAVGGSVNAIDKAILVKQAVDRFAEKHMKEFPNCRTNIGIFRAGTLPSIVPGMAELQVNNSYAAAEAQKALDTTGRWGAATFRADFENAVRQAVSDDPWFKEKPVEISWIKDPYPFDTGADDPYVQLAARTATQVHGRPIKAAPMPAWFDGAHLSRMLKVPTFGMGSGTAGLPHSANESVLVDDLYRGAQAVALTMLRIFEGRV